MWGCIWGGCTHHFKMTKILHKIHHNSTIKRCSPQLLHDFVWLIKSHCTCLRYIYIFIYLFKKAVYM